MCRITFTAANAGANSLRVEFLAQPFKHHQIISAQICVPFDPR